MIESESFRSEYNGNDTATTFAYGFPVSSKNYLTVTVTDSDDVETTLTVDVDYTVNGVGSADDADWDITYPISGDPLPTGSRLTIVPDLPLTQLTDFENQGGFFPDTHENAVDYLTVLSQQQQEQLDRCVKVTVGSDTDPADLIANLETDAAAAAASAAAASSSASSASTSASNAAASAAAAAVSALLSTSEGVRGYRTQALASADITLVAGTDVLNQEFTGTNGAANSIVGSVVAAPAAGLAFYVFLVGAVISNSNTLTIKSGSTTLLTFNEAGTYYGTIKMISTGSAWVARTLSMEIL